MSRGRPRPPPLSARAPSAAAPPDPFEEVHRPATARIGRGRGPDRGLRVAAVLVVAGLGLALAKPWDWGNPAATPPADTATPSEPRPAVTVAPTASPPGPGAGLDCMSDNVWTAVIDEVDGAGRALTRSWIRIAPLAAGGPDDPAIGTVRVYAEAVPRLGFCAPVRGAHGVPGRPIATTAWRLERDAASDRSTPIRMTLTVESGGTVGDGGALYGPPLAAEAAPAAAAGDPEATWAVDAPPGRPGRWSTGPAPARSWPLGTYVLAVESPTALPGPAGVRWFAIELRGPWTGPSANPAAPSPAGRPSGAPAATPAPPG